jgi:hypothetical protein
LPAFGSFTGGHVVNEGASDDAVFVVAEGSVLSVK